MIDMLPLVLALAFTGCDDYPDVESKLLLCARHFCPFCRERPDSAPDDDGDEDVECDVEP